MKVKEALDSLFEGVKFDDNLYKRLMGANIDFITSTVDHKELFGSRHIGCFYFSYTMFHKNIFYETVFNMTYDEVVKGIANITTIPKNFSTARDDINLVTFYIAHRFLSNKELSKDKQITYAEEALTYFSYRTLVHISSSYWVYPITEEKAVSLSERLSNKYIIKQVKNWNEYCQYRSREYLKTRYGKLLVRLTDDRELPNAITDLVNRTKETLKSIYREFLEMNEDDNIISTSKNVVTDLEGREVLMERTEDRSLYITKVENCLTDRNSFIKREYMEVAVGVVESVSMNQLEDTLGHLFEYYFLNKKTSEQVRSFISDFLINTFEYLQTSQVSYSGRGNVLKIVDSIVGNVLYTRGTDATITKVKEDGDKLIKDLFRKYKVNMGSRSRVGVRNSLCIYILLLALL